MNCVFQPLLGVHHRRHAVTTERIQRIDKPERSRKGSQVYRDRWRTQEKQARQGE